MLPHLYALYWFCAFITRFGVTHVKAIVLIPISSVSPLYHTPIGNRYQDGGDGRQRRHRHRRLGGHDIPVGDVYNSASILEIFIEKGRVLVGRLAGCCVGCKSSWEKVRTYSFSYDPLSLLSGSVARCPYTGCIWDSANTLRKRLGNTRQYH